MTRRLRPVHYMLALTAGFVGVPYFALMHANPLVAERWRAARDAVGDAALAAARRGASAAGIALPAPAPPRVLAPAAPPPSPADARGALA